MVGMDCAKEGRGHQNLVGFTEVVVQLVCLHNLTVLFGPFCTHFGDDFCVSMSKRTIVLRDGGTLNLLVQRIAIDCHRWNFISRDSARACDLDPLRS